MVKLYNQFIIPFIIRLVYSLLPAAFAGFLIGSSPPEYATVR